MNRQFLLPVLLLMAAFLSCQSIVPPTLEPQATPELPATPDVTTEEVVETPSAPTIVPIGLVERQNDLVEHGLGGVQELQQLESSADLFPEDAVRVSGGGEALLDFGDNLRLILFNDSQMSITSRPAADAPPIVHFFLFWGGFTGDKLPEEGGIVEIETPSGAKITVTGTSFFVSYNLGDERTTVGNWNGSMSIDRPGGSTNVPSGHYTWLDGGLSTNPHLPLTLSAEQFGQVARSGGSVHAAVKMLETGTPGSTVTPSPTAAGQVPLGTYLLEANCRLGPGTVYRVVDVFRAEEQVQVVGRNRDSSWWLVRELQTECWSHDSVLNVENRNLVPEVPTPVPPTLTPTPSPSPSPTPMHITPTPSPTSTLEPPAAPEGLELANSCDSPNYPVHLFWVDKATNEDGYIVYRRLWSYEEDGWGKWQLLTNKLPPDSNQYTDTDGTGDSILYWVGAYNNAGTAWISGQVGPCIS